VEWGFLPFLIFVTGMTCFVGVTVTVHSIAALGYVMGQVEDGETSEANHHFPTAACRVYDNRMHCHRNPVIPAPILERCGGDFAALIANEPAPALLAVLPRSRRDAHGPQSPAGEARTEARRGIGG
jgi:hypothetical protein